MVGNILLNSLPFVVQFYCLFLVLLFAIVVAVRLSTAGMKCIKNAHTSVNINFATNDLPATPTPVVEIGQ